MVLKKELKLRLYQQEILNTIVKGNTLVVIPTGLGKTIIALALSIIRKNRYPEGKIIFLAPTKPLVEQHKELFEEYTMLKCITATGKTPPEERKKMYENLDVIFATPQTIQNDLITGGINFEDITLMIIDEAHRATADYSYNFVTEQYNKIAKNPHVLALTASPGHDMERIKEICKNLGIERIEIRSENDELVSPYVKEKKTIPVIVDLPEKMKEIQRHLIKTNKKIIEKMHNAGITQKKKLSKGEILKIQGELQKAIARREVDYKAYNAIKLLSASFKIIHALELFETESVESTKKYIRRIREQKTGGMKLLMGIPDFLFAIEKILNCSEEHPKYNELEGIIKKEMKEEKKIIIFTKLRETSKKITAIINKIENVNAASFVGQKEGMTQKKQLEILNEFKQGKYNILVATSIGEEGLHVENADIGIFFEPSASALRTIQRRGRIGRANIGKIYVMMTKGCIDEKYYWVSKYREKNMNKTLDDMQKHGDLNEY